MRASILGALLGALAFLPVAHGGVEFGPRAGMFLSYGFDRPDDYHRQTLTYGLQIDHDWRAKMRSGQAPMIRLQFADLAFDRFSVAGVPLATRQMILQANGGFMGFISNNFGPLVLATAGAGLALTTLEGEQGGDDTDPAGEELPENNINCASQGNDGAPGSQDDVPDSCPIEEAEDDANDDAGSGGDSGGGLGDIGGILGLR